MQLAIAYIWLTEDTWDKEYIKTHTIGFDKLKDYILGKEDGIPKTPEWASAPLTGVPSQDHQGAGQGVGQEKYLRRPRQRRLVHQGPLFHRARPAGSSPAGHAGPR